MAEKTEDQKAAEAAAKAEAAKAEKLVEGRVLVATDEHKCDEVISLPAAAAKAAEKAGWLDTNADAVAYAKALAAGEAA